MPIVIINNKTEEVHTNVSKTKAAEIIGVSRQTIYNWSKKSKKEDYNIFTIYFDCKKEKIELRNKTNNSVLRQSP